MRLDTLLRPRYKRSYLKISFDKMIMKIVVSLFLIYTICSNATPSRSFTDYYEMPGSDLCIPIHHTLPHGSEFIRLHISYLLQFKNNIKRDTIYYLKRRVSSCLGTISFSTLENKINKAIIQISMSWEISETHTIIFFYEFINMLDSNIEQLISKDDLFAIPVTLSTDGQDYLYISQVSVEAGISLFSTITYDNRAICIKVDNNKLIFVYPYFLDDYEPTDQITYVKIYVIRPGFVFSKKYTAYSCGSDDQYNYRSSFKLVRDVPDVEKIEFYAIFKHYRYISDGKYETEEKDYEFNLNYNLDYEYVDQQNYLYNEEPRLYLLETSTVKSYCLPTYNQFSLTKSYRNKNLYASLLKKDKLSQYVYRSHIEPLSALPKCDV